MAHLEHDNIVKIYSETLDGQKNVRLACMQYVPGTTLEKVLEKIGDAKQTRCTAPRCSLSLTH